MAAKRKTETKVKSLEPKTTRASAPVASASKKASIFSSRRNVALIGAALVVLLLLAASRSMFIAATVNGTPIYRLSVVRELEKQSGSQVLENLVNEALIEQEGRKQGVTVSEQELAEKIDELRQQLTEQGQDLDAILEMRGISDSEFKKQIRIQILVEKLLADLVQVSDEDVEQFLETNAEFLPEGMTDEEKRELARDELRQQQLSVEFSQWLEGLKASASINYLVEY